MYVKDYREVPSEPGGADGLTVRWVINASQGATNFAMRVFELEPGKARPSPARERTRGLVLADEWRVGNLRRMADLKNWFVIFIPAQENHRFRNTGKEVMQFIDVIMFPSKLHAIRF